VIGGIILTAFANWQTLSHLSPMDWPSLVAKGLLQGTGLGTLMPALGKVAFSSLDPKSRPEGAVLFNLSRHYGSTIWIAVVQIFFYDNAQAMHLALAKNLAP
jgi:DHA2 family multidrug resistance protein